MNLRPSAFAVRTVLALGFVASLGLVANSAIGKPPAGPPPAGTLSLDVWADGVERLHLLLGVSQKESGEPGLVHRISEDGGNTWSDPVAVGEGQAVPFAPHRGMDPQIAGRGDRLVAAWMVAGTGTFGSGPLATAFSEDGGRSWQAGTEPSDLGTSDGTGFMDLAVAGDGIFHLVWLDRREDRRGLRHAESSDGGRTWSPNATVDPETCECCWNTLALWDDGTPLVLYRAREPRDMAVSVRFGGGAGSAAKWSQPAAVGSFGWQFDGCPHVGGGLALVEAGKTRSVHAVVWTGREGVAGVYHVESSDGGLIWSEPQFLAGVLANHPDIAAAGCGTLAAVWSEPDGDGRRVRAARRGPDDQSWGPASTLTGARVAATHPRVVPAVGGFRVFWTEAGGEGEQGVWRSAPYSVEP